MNHGMRIEEQSPNGTIDKYRGSLPSILGQSFDLNNTNRERFISQPSALDKDYPICQSPSIIEE